jgi:hypothetical protein
MAIGLASLVAVGGYGVVGAWINPAVEVVTSLRVNVLVLAVAGLLWARGRLGGTGSGNFQEGGAARRFPLTGPASFRAWGLPVVVGGVLGAAFVSPWAAFPWLVIPAVALGWARKGWYDGSGAVAVAVLTFAGNAALLAGISSRGLRISPAEMEAKDFRANTLFSDVPVHDAWAIELKGRPSPTLEDLIHVFRAGSPQQATPAITGLGMLRGVVGSTFGWEDPRWSDGAYSFVGRLTDNDRHRSAAASGEMLGIWKVLYVFPREAAVETLNGTVHVAVIAGLEEDGGTTRLVLSFRVREVNWTTLFYMRLIDPARRFFVYPSLLRQFAHTWNRENWESPGETPTGQGGSSADESLSGGGT